MVSPTVRSRILLFGLFKATQNIRVGVQKTKVCKHPCIRNNDLFSLVFWLVCPLQNKREHWRRNIWWVHATTVWHWRHRCWRLWVWWQQECWEVCVYFYNLIFKQLHFLSRYKDYPREWMEEVGLDVLERQNIVGPTTV